MCVRLHVCLMTFLAKQQLLLLPTQFLIFVVKLPPSCSIWKKNAKNSINKQTNKNKQQSIKIKQILTLTFHVLVNSRPLETPFSPAPSAARAFPGVPPLAAPAGGASLSRRCCLARTWRDEVSWPRPRTGTPCWGIYGGCKQHTALVSLKLLNLFGEQGLLVLFYSPVVDAYRLNFIRELSILRKCQVALLLENCNLCLKWKRMNSDQC